MTDLRKAAEMALEFVDWLCGDDHSIKPKNKALDVREALRQALAQQERLNEITRQFVGVNEDGSERWVETEYRTVIRSEWVGYTNEDRERIVPVLVQSLLNHDEKTMAMLLKAILIDIELQLKEKNT